MTWIETTMTGHDGTRMQVFLNMDRVESIRPHTRGTLIMWASPRAATVVAMPYDALKKLIEGGS